MDEVFQKYKQKKFFKCLELIQSIPNSNDLVENLVLENCKLICESLIRINENDPDKMCETQEKHYLFFEKVISIHTITKSVPVQLELNATFNFIFWLLFYSDMEFNDFEAEEYFKLLNKGLLTVVGRKITSESTSNVVENVINNLVSLKELIQNENYKTALLVIELAVVVILFIIKLKRTLLRKCLSITDFFINESKYIVNSLGTVNEFLQIKSVTLCLCKFSLSGTPTVLPEIHSGVIDCLHLLKSVLLFLLEDFKGSLKSLQVNVNSSMKTLWHYMVILNAYELENWNLCSGFLSKMSTLVVEKNLKTRLHIMRGKINCVERNYKEALQQFQNALMLCPYCPIVYCYIGQVYGKMGMFDLMVENFEKLVETFQLEESETDMRENFETVLLSWIHPANEIIEVEAYYALAVSYGLSENFKNAAESFEKVIQCSNNFGSIGKKRSIDLPSLLTVLHEAAMMNLMLGNLVRAEQIAMDALDQYVPQAPLKIHDVRKSLVCRDTEWLQKVIRQELLETDLEPKELSNEIQYSEDLISIFPENVIALLILSEIQRIHGLEDYKTTLSNVFSMFSKYLSSTNKKEEVGENEKCVLTLVRALAGKTCVRIAEIQLKEIDNSSVEKMLKRALSCNKGDKDALYRYYNFLIKLGRNREAFKLWNTFFKEKEAIAVDSLQSFSLQYFLMNKITKRELEKIQREIESSDIKLL